VVSKQRLPASLPQSHAHSGPCCQPRGEGGAAGVTIALQNELRTYGFTRESHSKCVATSDANDAASYNPHATASSAVNTESPPAAMCCIWPAAEEIKSADRQELLC
jgi:hypothetical protein